jgi:hypothetical protein
MAHARRKFFVLADISASARRKAHGKAPAVISPPIPAGSPMVTASGAPCMPRM